LIPGKGTDVVALKGYYESEGKRMNGFIDKGFGGLVKLTEIRDEEADEHNEKKDRLEQSCRDNIKKWMDKSKAERQKFLGIL